MAVEEIKPKVLIVSRTVWDENLGTASTLSNLFTGYGPDKLAHIYIETIPPKTAKCGRFFQISEITLLQKVFKWRLKPGREVSAVGESPAPESGEAKAERNLAGYVRKHRSIFISIFRELLWSLGGWKTRELKDFIKDFDPDVVWIDGSPLILMNKLSSFVVDCAGKPASLYVQDDVYTYEPCDGPLSRMLRFFLRKEFKKLVGKCSNMFVISPKMKREYDAFFNVDSTVITKGVPETVGPEIQYSAHLPVKMVYMGQILYGRITTLRHLAEAVSRMNENQLQVELSIYTQNRLTDDVASELSSRKGVHLEKPVPYTELGKVLSSSDVLLFVESFQKKFCNLARLSFSTKLTDYLASGRCILAMGPAELASIEYLKDNNAAILVSDLADMDSALASVLNPELLSRYANNARACANLNHSETAIRKIILEKLNALAGNC